MTAFSDRASALVRTFQAALKALDDHKLSGERQHVYDVIAAHVRAASPMSMSALPDPVIAPVLEGAPLEPTSEVIVPLQDGARIELRIIDEQVNLYVIDGLQHDCNVGLRDSQVEQLRRDLARVMGSR